MKKMKKLTLLILTTTAILVITSPIVSKSALQSNGGTAAKYNRNTWMQQIRNMETLGGSLGLEDTINTTNMKSSATESNNLDIHMQKNTEYGAMAILSASEYGNPNKIANGETTTGNKTGIVIPYTNEWTATQYTDRLEKTSYANRYINYYVGSNLEKKNGDATIETQGWHKTLYFYANGQKFNGTHEYRPGGLVRNCNNGIFSFNNSYGLCFINGSAWYSGSVSRDTTAFLSNSYTSRAVVVIGQEF